MEPLPQPPERPYQLGAFDRNADHPPHEDNDQETHATVRRLEVRVVPAE